MNPNDNQDYNPAEDDNQGVVQPLAQATNGGFSQSGGIAIPTAQGPETIREEVNASDTDANGVNDDLLAEEDVEAGNVNVEYEEGDN
ncbi:hypothetical protein [Spirosoma montaniterrae]|uniref:Uncharacterized protein n=1 Tax=Spirosoma montaniterrae TaxID=1178516 RepID=A0A1P9WS04_9BACT|nr:hypothetical protein [Spirosoma montaniterrae]AQG78144.1 hypothetical protein AWR27_01525 [Spirosoma montaniterrae]